MNASHLIGRLVNEPELRFTQTGMGIMNVTIAVDRPLSKEKKEERKQKGEATADFPRVVLMGKSAELAQKYLKKGDLFSVTGSIRTSQYENAEGKTVYTTDVVCEKLQFLEFRKHSDKESPVESIDPIAEYELEEVPF